MKKSCKRHERKKGKKKTRRAKRRKRKKSQKKKDAKEKKDTKVKKEDKGLSSATKESRGWAKPLAGLKMCLKAAAFGTGFAHTSHDRRLGTQTEILN